MAEGDRRVSVEVMSWKKDSVTHYRLWRGKGPGAKKSGQPLRDKRQEVHSPPAPLIKEHSLANVLILVQGHLFQKSDFHNSKSVNLPYSKFTVIWN